MKKGMLLLRTIFFLIFFACSSEQIDEESITPSQYKLTIKASEGGTITPDANGIYNKGATITVTASPDEGYKFIRWEGSDNDNQPYGCWAGPGKCRTSITMDSDRDVKAFFEKIK
jgi:hypothetical protein